MKLPVSRWTVGAVLAALVVASVQFFADRDAGSDDADGLAAVAHGTRASSVNAVATSTAATAGALAGNSRGVPEGNLVARVDGLKSRLDHAPEINDIFASAAPKEVAAAPVVASPPQAPAFPYTVMGNIVDAGIRRIFLSDGQKVLVVKAADTVDGVYHVDSISADEMKVTYLPLHLEQQIFLGP